MKAKIVTTFIGCFGVDDDKVLTYVKFPKDPEKIARKIRESEENKIPEEKKVEKYLKEHGYNDVVKKESTFINDNLPGLAIEKGFVKSKSEFNKMITNVSVQLTKKKIKKAVGKDKLIMQASGALDELDKSINILVERLIEWYGLHFPEMEKIINNNERYAKIVDKFGTRDRIKDPKLIKVKNNSMGIDLDKPDQDAIKSFADEVVDLYELRDHVSSYLDNIVKELAPNMSEVAGETLAAKLISLSGGLDKLSKMPSSTIQLLGAEKALFRHLHGRGKSPKHGIIITHPLVQKAPASESGKVARLLSAKISIASKLDFFSDKNNGKELRKELEESVKDALR